MKHILIKVLIILIVILGITLNVKAAGIDGTTIVLNPGHGGSDPGCINAEKGLAEKNIVLSIANYLKDYLNQFYNVKVILTHDGVNFPGNDTLADRAMIARNNNADLYVSLHINSLADKSVNGANVYVTNRTELYKYKEGMTLLGNKILKNLSDLGIKNNGVINNKMCRNTDEDPKYKYYDGKNADYYGDIRYAMKGDTSGLGANLSDGSGVSAVLIEHCYIKNAHDSEFLDSEADLKKLAEADGKAIVDYFGLKLAKDVITDITVDKCNINLIKGESCKINADIEPKTVTNKNLVWSSSNKNVASVDSNGNIKGIETGNAIITVASKDNPNVFKTINVNVEQYELKFENKQENLLVGKAKNVSVIASPSWIENKNLTWESSDESIVEVDNKGKITAKKPGKAIIKVIWKERNLSDEIEVNSKELSKETKIEISKYNVENYQISKIGEKVKINEFLNNIYVSDNLEIQIKKANENQEYVGTNTKVIIKEKESNLEIEEYDCLIYGDINGDGKISAMDYTLIKNHIMDVKKITNKNMKLTADINGDNRISAMDYTLIKNHIMDVKKIEEK